MDLSGNDIVGIDVGGKGASRSGANMIGGGFGPAGAAEGMAIAYMANSLTAKTSIESILSITTRESKFIFRYRQHAADDLDILLARPVAAIERGPTG